MTAGAIFFFDPCAKLRKSFVIRLRSSKGGRLIRSGTMDEVKGDESLESVFLELEAE